METKKCPFCAEDIKLEAIKCKHCGEFLETNETEPEELSAQTEVDDTLARQLYEVYSLVSNESSFLGKSGEEEVAQLVQQLCDTKENAKLVLTAYQKLYEIDFIEHVKDNFGSLKSVEKISLPCPHFFSSFSS